MTRTQRLFLLVTACILLSRVLLANARTHQPAGCAPGPGRQPTEERVHAQQVTSLRTLCDRAE